MIKRQPVVPRNVAYLRVSTQDQDTEKNKDDILRFANDRKFGHVEFVEEKVSGRKSWKERKIAGIVDDLSVGHRIITPELSRLGRSTLEVLEILNAAKERGIAVFSVKEKIELNGDDIQSKVMATMLSLFAELERNFISMRTKEALAAKKKEGVKLGRPVGSFKSKLDCHRDEIVALLKMGVTKVKIAEKYGCDRSLVHKWLTKNKIQA
ncbi:resolvase domain protein [Desulfosarcina variabilis str. Montpellier]